MSVTIRSAGLLPLRLAMGRPGTSDYFLTTATAGRMTTGMAYTYSTLSICFRGLSGRRKLCPCAPNGAGSRELPLLRLLLPWSPCSSARQRGQAQRRVMIPAIPIRLIPLTSIQLIPLTPIRRRLRRRPRALLDILRQRRIRGVAAGAQARCGTRVGVGGARAGGGGTRAGHRLDGAGPAGGGAGVGVGLSGSPSVGDGAAGGAVAAAGTAASTVASMAGLPMPASTAAALAVASTAAAFTISQRNTARHD